MFMTCVIGCRPSHKSMFTTAGENEEWALLKQMINQSMVEHIRQYIYNDNTFIHIEQ